MKSYKIINPRGIKDLDILKAIVVTNLLKSETSLVRKLKRDILTRAEFISKLPVGRDIHLIMKNDVGGCLGDSGMEFVGRVIGINSNRIVFAWSSMKRTDDFFPAPGNESSYEHFHLDIKHIDSWDMDTRPLELVYDEEYNKAHNIRVR